MNQFVLIMIISSLLLIAPGGAETLVTGGPYISGDVINIRGDTNFNTENQVLVEIYPASFGPTSKFDPAMTGGGAAVVPVFQTGTGTFGWTVNMSSTGWNPDEYIVRIEVIGKDFRESGLLTLTEMKSGDRNGTGTINQIADPGAGVNNPGTIEQPVNDGMIHQELKEEMTPDTMLPTLSETTAPQPTQKSPVTFGTILVSLVSLCLIRGFCRK